MIYYPIQDQSYLAVTPIVEEIPISADNTYLLALNDSFDEPLYDDIATVTPEVDTFSTTTLIKRLWGDSGGDTMIKILTCESGLKQWDDRGETLLSPTDDLGISQINQVWWDKAKELGYDLNITVDNLNMAYYIWKQQGFNAWMCYRKLSTVFM